MKTWRIFCYDNEDGDGGADFLVESRPDRWYGCLSPADKATVESQGSIMVEGELWLDAHVDSNRDDRDEYDRWRLTL